MDGLLRVEGISKGQILDNVSFILESGEMLAIMGPSGSGKSTLLYQVAGMDVPSSGKVWLGGTEITGLSEDEKAKLRLHRMGFVFQQMNMMANLNLLDNILLPAIQANRKTNIQTNTPAWLVGHRNKGRCKMSKSELTIKAKTLMQKFGISDLESRRITQVSGGQLQRACICRSMMNEPEILFVDEPTGALNKSAAQEVMEVLLGLNREGVTIMTVTHDSKVASCCDRILYLLDGRICGELDMGKPKSDCQKQREEKVSNWLMGMGW